ncbi:MAG: ABC-2 family transporter protein [Planctomycetaceae bacterium]
MHQGLYDFWFYITVFARYPRSIYTGSALGTSIQFAFSFVIPILLVVTVPARILLGKINDQWWSTWFVVVLLVASASGLLLSRRIFQYALRSYRSASS